MKSCCLQYSRFIQLLQKLVTSPCGNIEENYIKKFSREISAQLQKVVIEPLKHDDRGVAFSTGEGNNFKLVGNAEFLSSSH